jgi:hypothetical protein
MLAAWEPHRFSIQMLHEYDPCCFAGHSRHAGILQYNAAIQAVLDGGADTFARRHGMFSTAISNWNVHAVCPMDKLILRTALAQTLQPQPDFDHLPCDILRAANNTPCPFAAPPSPKPKPPPKHAHLSGCFRDALPPCVFTRASCPTAPAPSQMWHTEMVPADNDSLATVLRIVHTQDGQCLTMPTKPHAHSTLTISKCIDSGAGNTASVQKQQQHFLVSPSGKISPAGGIHALASISLCLNNGLPMGHPANELQLYGPCDGAPSSNEKFTFSPNGILHVHAPSTMACVDVCLDAISCRNVSDAKVGDGLSGDKVHYNGLQLGAANKVVTGTVISNIDRWTTSRASVRSYLLYVVRLLMLAYACLPACLTTSQPPTVVFYLNRV